MGSHSCGKQLFTDRLCFNHKMTGFITVWLLKPHGSLAGHRYSGSCSELLDESMTCFTLYSDKWTNNCTTHWHFQRGQDHKESAADRVCNRCGPHMIIDHTPTTSSLWQIKKVCLYLDCFMSQFFSYIMHSCKWQCSAFRNNKRT